MEKRGETLGLSLREAEALEHVVNGKTNEEASMLMGISKRTVEKHLQMTYKKLNVENRTAAAALVYRIRSKGK